MPILLSLVDRTACVAEANNHFSNGKYPLHDGEILPIDQPTNLIEGRKHFRIVVCSLIDKPKAGFECLHLGLTVRALLDARHELGGRSNFANEPLKLFAHGVAPIHVSASMNCACGRPLAFAEETMVW